MIDLSLIGGIKIAEECANRRALDSMKYRNGGSSEWN